MLVETREADLLKLLEMVETYMENRGHDNEECSLGQCGCGYSLLDDLLTCFRKKYG